MSGKSKLNEKEALDREAVKKAQIAYNETLNNDDLGDAEYVIRAYLASLPEAPAVPVAEAIRKALVDARYVPGDYPVVPVKVAAFMKEVERIISAELSFQSSPTPEDVEVIVQGKWEEMS